MTRKSAFIGFRCTQCGRGFPSGQTASTCTTCGGILDTAFDEESLPEISKASLTREPSMWRFRSFLPVPAHARTISAGEGNSPLRRLKSEPGRVWVKDETHNPTGTFKDRGASVAVTFLALHGVENVVLSSEGNAGCSFALYSNMARIKCNLFLPNRANPEKVHLSRKLGANVHQVEGTISDAGRKAAATSARTKAYNASTFVTPLRHDGKGTMGLEICESIGWTSPDWVVYPIGGGVGLVGMWKMFKILKNIGWINRTPRFAGIQPEGCAPIVKAYNSGRDEVEEWKSPNTIALGLRIPKPLAGRWILKILRESRSVCRTVTDWATSHTLSKLARDEGLILEPSSAVAFAALPSLYADGIIDKSEDVVVIGTGSGLKALTNP